MQAGPEASSASPPAPLRRGRSAGSSPHRRGSRGRLVAAGETTLGAAAGCTRSASAREQAWQHISIVAAARRRKRAVRVSPSSETLLQQHEENSSAGRRSDSRRGAEVRGQVGEVLRRARLLHGARFVSQRDESTDPTSLPLVISRVPPGQEPGRFPSPAEVQPRGASERGAHGRRAAEETRLLYGAISAF